MKTINHLTVLLMLGAGILWGCDKEASPLNHKAPEVTFPVSETALTASVGEPVDFKAQIVAGDRLTCGWYIDDRLEASTAAFSYTFTTPGNYNVRFEARNGAGSVGKSYTVTVSDILKMHLSVADSTRISRLQLSYLKVLAVVDAGSGVTHSWSVDGEVLSDKAFFDTFNLPLAKVYTVTYTGHNAVGNYTKTFEVEALERPLQIAFSNTASTISCKQGSTVELTATVEFGGTGIVHQWKVGDTVVSSTSAFSYAFTGAGPYTITYHAVNGKGETIDRTWTVNILPSGVLFESFESYTALPSWWTLNENNPGISLATNPKKSGINTSTTVLSDYVQGTTGTSGYFTLKTSMLLSGKNIDVSKYSKIRFKVYLGKNKYYPRIDIGGTKYAPIANPQFNDEWEILEYHFTFKFDPTKNIVFRPLLQSNGSSIASGAITDTNTRTVYIDDIEFLE